MWIQGIKDVLFIMIGIKFFKHKLVRKYKKMYGKDFLLAEIRNIDFETCCFKFELWHAWRDSRLEFNCTLGMRFAYSLGELYVIGKERKLFLIGRDCTLEDVIKAWHYELSKDKERREKYIKTPFFSLND